MNDHLALACHLISRLPIGSATMPLATGDSQSWPLRSFVIANLERSRGVDAVVDDMTLGEALDLVVEDLLEPDFQTLRYMCETYCRRAFLEPNNGERLMDKKTPKSNSEIADIMLASVDYESLHIDCTANQAMLALLVRQCELLAAIGWSDDPISAGRMEVIKGWRSAMTVSKINALFPEWFRDLQLQEIEELQRVDGPLREQMLEDLQLTMEGYIERRARCEWSIDDLVKNGDLSEFSALVRYALKSLDCSLRDLSHELVLQLDGVGETTADRIMAWQRSYFVAPSD